VSGSDDCTLRDWDPATGACEEVLEGHEQHLRLTATAAPTVQAAGALAATWVLRTSGRSVQVWDAATGECLRVVCGHDELVTCVAALLSDDGVARAVSSCWDGTLRVWDASTDQEERVLVSWRATTQ